MVASVLSPRWLILIALLIAPALAFGANKHVLVKADTLSMRSEPKTSSKRLETLVTFQPVEIVETQDKWSKVKTLENKQGWVLSSYLTPNAFVRVDNERGNVRRGPGTEYAVTMYLGQNYPLRVLDIARNGWLKILDVEGDRGWIHPTLAKLEPNYVITRFAHSNLRKEPGTETEILFTAEKGAIFEVLKNQSTPDGKEWLFVKYSDGDTAWISSNIVFGWNEVDDPSPKDKTEGDATAKGEKGDVKADDNAADNAADEPAKDEAQPEKSPAKTGKTSKKGKNKS